MQINSELCHVDDSKIIVRVTVSKNQVLLSSALGQGKDVKEAENTALQEALRRINLSISDLDIATITQKNIPDQTNLNPIQKTKINVSSEDQLINLPTYNSNNIPEVSNPNDWSEEITQIEQEISRIGWSKDEENIFMRETIERQSRDRVTDYDDIILFISLLKKIKAGTPINNINKYINLEELINISNKLLSKLQWETSTARSFLETNFNKSSRSQLSRKELLKFIQLLEKESSK